MHRFHHFPILLPTNLNPRCPTQSLELPYKRHYLDFTTAIPLMFSTKTAKSHKQYIYILATVCFSNPLMLYSNYKPGEIVVWATKFGVKYR